MKETDSIKELELQAQNTRNLVDRINQAAYGVTVTELLRALSKEDKDEDDH